MRIIYTTMGDETICPVCQGTLHRVPYFLGEVSGTNVQAYTHQKVITTTYSDITKRSGGICVDCGARKYRAENKLGLITFLLGLIIIFAPFIAEILFGHIAQAAIGPVVVMGIILFYIGVRTFVKANKLKLFSRPEALDVQQGKLSELFILNMDRSKIPTGFTALGIFAYEKMKTSASKSPIHEGALQAPASLTIIRDSSFVGVVVPTIITLNGTHAVTLKNGESATIQLTTRYNALQTNSVGSPNTRYEFNVQDGAHGEIHVSGGVFKVKNVIWR